MCWSGKGTAYFPMLSNKEEYHPWTKSKPVDCIRVDGAGDEGPIHLEVQFQWTEWHLSQGKTATMVTTRHSGGSYLNRVEMQNGCLALGQSNLFIPSALTGPNMTDKGLDTEKLSENLNAAVDVYISRVDGAPCGENAISLHKGAAGEYANTLQERREDLLTFLKGSEVKRSALKTKNPERYNYFKLVWNIRKRHMVTDVPGQYVFFLLPCYEKECQHPVCKRGKPEVESLWFKAGPTLSTIPFPIPDPSRP